MERLIKCTLRSLLVCLITVMVVGGGRANADFTFGTPTNLGPPINSLYNEEVMAMPADGLSVFFVSNRPGGYGSYDIWVAKRQSTEDPWGEPENLGPTINSAYPDFYVSISPDGLTLYYSDGPPYWTPRPGGLGNGDIWVTKRASLSDPWTEPVNLGAPVNSTNCDACPSISADGLILVFTRDYSYRQPELWLAVRKTTSDPWDTPIKLANVNSGWDYAGNISGDGRTLFWFRGGNVDDNFMVTRTTTHEDFGSPVKLPYPVNTEYTDGMPYISCDGSVFYFVSDRPGGVGGHDLWQVTIEPGVDLNTDGIVDAADMCIIVDNWGTDDPLCDIGPMPWGDGIVDVQDLIVLAEHLFTYPGAVAYWTLDEMEGDIACDGIGDYNGTLVGNPIWQPEGGVEAGALQFDGVDDYVRTDFVLNPAEGCFSIFTWVNGGVPGQTIVSQQDAADWLKMDAAGNLMTELKGTGRSASPLQSQTTITNGDWHRIGLVWDGSYRRLYVDGLVVAEDEQDNLDISVNGLYFGTGKAMEPDSFWSGLIDDIRIYNRAVHP